MLKFNASRNEHEFDWLDFNKGIFVATFMSKKVHTFQKFTASALFNIKCSLKANGVVDMKRDNKCVYSKLIKVSISNVYVSLKKNFCHTKLYGILWLVYNF